MLALPAAFAPPSTPVIPEVSNPATVALLMNAPADVEKYPLTILTPLATVKFELPFNKPENVAPAELLLVSVAAALTVMLRAVLNAVVPVSVKLPPLNVILPVVAPRLAFAEIDRVPAEIVVSPP